MRNGHVATRRTLAATVALCAALLQGCASGPAGVRPEIRTDAGHEPSVTGASDTVTISFEMRDRDLTPATVRVQCLVGGTWHDATLSSPSSGVLNGCTLTGCAPAADWQVVTVEWDTWIDGAGQSGESPPPTTVRLTPSDIDGAGTEVEFQAAIDNFKPRPAVSTSQLSFEYDYRDGTNPSAASVGVTNTGPVGTTLDWTRTETLHVGAGWLTSSPASGTTTTETDDMLVSVDPVGQGLTPGTYTADIAIDDPSALGSPVTVAVTLTVHAPVLSVSDDHLFFNHRTSRTSNPDDQSFTVANAGHAGTQLVWSASISYHTGAGWLSVSPDTGTTTGETDTVVVSVDPVGSVLGPGEYTADVVLTDAEAQGSPATVAVVLNVYPPVWFVDDDAPGPVHDGCTWQTAVLHPQDAVDAAIAGETINVAQGTYGPRSPGVDTVLLTMKQGVQIYGGYAGVGASDPDDRDHDAYATTIDGAGAVEHVVVGASDAALDGFVVRGGDTGGAWGDPYGGGGMDNTDVTNLTVADCTFTENFGIYGSGMRNTNSPVTVTDCVFHANGANVGRGAGMYNYGCSPQITGCIISSNTAGMGGGMQNEEGSSPTITECFFVDNLGTMDGGGLRNNHSSDPVITNCVFVGNSARDRIGGAINNRNYSNPTFINCTIVGNSAGASGGAVGCQESGSGTAVNCLIWDNTAPNYPAIGPGFSATYSLVQGGYAGTGNISADPLLVDVSVPEGPDGVWGTIDDGLRLSAGSPAIDAGWGDNYATVPATDILGNARMDDAATADTGVGTPTYVDMGAYERQ